MGQLSVRQVLCYPSNPIFFFASFPGGKITESYPGSVLSLNELNTLSVNPDFYFLSHFKVLGHPKVIAHTLGNISL